MDRLGEALVEVRARSGVVERVVAVLAVRVQQHRGGRGAEPRVRIGEGRGQGQAEAHGANGVGGEVPGGQGASRMPAR